METKLTRENRTMSKLTVVTAGLLVMLAASGIASAATVVLSIEVANTQLSLDGLNGPTSTTYTVYGLVTNNTTDDGYGQPNSVVDGGFATFKASQAYSTGDGRITSASVAAPPASGKSLASTAVNTQFSLKQQGFQLDQNGNYLTAAFTPVIGVGGIENTAGAMSPPGSFDYMTDPTPFEYGNGTAAVLYTGTLKPVADGYVTLNLVPGDILVWSVAGGLGVAAVAVPAGNVTGDSVTIHVGSAVVVKPIITSGPVAEGGWSDEPGWNNPAHSVNITSDAVGACIWKISDGTTNWTLAATDPSFILTIGDIAAAGATLPPPYASGEDHSADPLYNWTLTVTAGGQTSDGVSVFVPEPATIGLLGFGIVGALLRRRRA